MAYPAVGALMMEQALSTCYAMSTESEQLLVVELLCSVQQDFFKLHSQPSFMIWSSEPLVKKKAHYNVSLHIKQSTVLTGTVSYVSIPFIGIQVPLNLYGIM